MPPAGIHVPTSAIVGGLWSLHEAGGQMPQHRLVEGVAGAFGRVLGGRAPDALDPPTSPTHRGGAHSAALGATLLVLRDQLRSCAEVLRAEADRWDAEAAANEEWSLDWVTCKLVALILRALVGLLNGFYAGYLCHLGLDIWTPCRHPDRVGGHERRRAKPPVASRHAAGESAGGGSSQTEGGTVADLDEQTGHVLCRSLERVLTRELGQPVTCHNVADSSLRWDIEALDGAGVVVRRISHTQTVPERMAMAGAELRDIRESADAALAQLGVTGVGASIHGRFLPQTRRRRQELGRELARRIARYQETGQQVTENPVAMILSGRHPHEDPVAAALAHVTVLPTRPDLPARIRASGDDRLGYRVPELHEEVLPAIATKQRRHGSLVSELTLVVEPVLSKVSATAIRELRARLGEEHQGFKSVYAGRVQAGRFPLRRIY